MKTKIQTVMMVIGSIIYAIGAYLAKDFNSLYNPIPVQTVCLIVISIFIFGMSVGMDIEISEEV